MSTSTSLLFDSDCHLDPQSVDSHDFKLFQDDPFLLSDLKDYDDIIPDPLASSHLLDDDLSHLLAGSLAKETPYLISNGHSVAPASPHVSSEGALSDERSISPPTIETELVVKEEMCLDFHDYCMSPSAAAVAPVIKSESSVLRHRRNGSTGSSSGNGSTEGDDGVVMEDDFDLFDEEDDEDDVCEAQHEEEEELEVGNSRKRIKKMPVSSSSTSNKSNSSQPGSTNSSPQSTGRRRAVVDRALTDEEKRLLAKEGFTNFPEGGVPLTKQQEKVLRKVRRKIRNKKSAQCSRQRKKEYVEELEKKYSRCTSENSVLKKEIFKLKKENSSLLMKIKNLLTSTGKLTNGLLMVSDNDTGSNSESTVSEGDESDFSTGQTSFKTSFFVLILSFIFILFPFMVYVLSIITIVFICPSSFPIRLCG